MLRARHVCHLAGSLRRRRWCRPWFVLCYGPRCRVEILAAVFLVEVASRRLAKGLAMACPAPISPTIKCRATCCRRSVALVTPAARFLLCVLGHLLEAAFPSQRAKSSHVKTRTLSTASRSPPMSRQVWLAPCTGSTNFSPLPLSRVRACHNQRLIWLPSAGRAKRS